MDAPHHVVGTSQAEQELYFAEKFSDKTKSALDILNRVPVEKICSKGKVQHVTTKDNLYAFTDLCISEHIQSAPIHNVEKQSHRAFIDVIDVVAHTLDVYNKVKADKNWEEGRKLWEAKNCQELADHSKRDPFSPVGEETPLLDVIEKFIKFKAHRLPIIDGAGELVHLISQLRVVEVLEKHIGKFKCATTTVKALQLGYKDCVYSVKESEAVATGFQTMLEHHVSGLAVLDAGGKVVGNLSATDMKHVASDRKVDLSQLELSVKDFCEAISKNTDPKLVRSPRILPWL
tara:strand:- start:2967 stop:3833 length:867 start_codon:yes stop_codon:yes gene_type:complete